ncbi:MAG: hypothetical protein HFI76_10415 [Lachnospiraceae bacterium]|nr:hypothetical protein [Lachnospiraceae bacterium]
MDVNNVSSSTYASKTSYSYQKPNTAAAEKETDVKKKEDAGVVYEKGSKADRSAIIAKMKADTEQRTNQMRSMVESMMKNQGQQIGNADSMWRFLAGGNFTVSAAAKAQAEAAIADDGYWGVSQTSERILNFAKALTGGDASKAEEMRAAFEKGFKQATKSWGQQLPSISQRTYDAVMEGFDKWVGKTAEEQQ